MKLDHMKETTGMIIPVWYPEEMSREEMQATLLPCLVDSHAFCAPENLMVVIDGAPKALDAVEQLHVERGGFTLLPLPENLGKGGAVAAGIERLMLNSDLEYFVARDHDNDHLANDTLNLVRLASHMRKQLGHDRIITIGRRHDIHRHLGFVRGEFETMMNDFVFEAVKFSAARSGRVLNTAFFSAYAPVLDMQTGFKCYTRPTARFMVNTMRRGPEIVPGLDIRRHGAEIPVIVETLLNEGVAGEVNRLAWECQPMTTYDLKGRQEVKGTVLAWVIQSTGLPLPIACRLLLNAIARRTMAKEEDGLNALLSMSRWAVKQVASMRSEKFEFPAGPSFSDYF